LAIGQAEHYMSLLPFQHFKEQQNQTKKITEIWGGGNCCNRKIKGSYRFTLSLL